MSKQFLKMYADWCSPCKFYEKTINTVRDNYPDIEFLEYNADFDFEIFEKYGVTSMPTTILLNNGEVVEKIMGALPAKHLTEVLDRLQAL